VNTYIIIKLINAIFRSKKLLFVIILLSYIAYIIPSLKIPFYLEDYSRIVKSVKLKMSGNLSDHSPVKKFIGHDLHAALDISKKAKLIDEMNLFYGGIDPSGFRVVNIFIHLLCGIMVFFLFITLFPGLDSVFAISAMSAFLFSPGALQPVIHISSRSDSICVFFMLLTLILYVKALNESGFVRALFYITISLLSFRLSLDFKETSVFILPVLFLYGSVLIQPVEKSGADSKRMFPIVIHERNILFFFPFMVLHLFYAIVETNAIERMGDMYFFYAIIAAGYIPAGLLFVILSFKHRVVRLRYHFLFDPKKLLEVFKEFIEALFMSILMLFPPHDTSEKIERLKRTMLIMSFILYVALFIFIALYAGLYSENYKILENILLQIKIFPFSFVKLLVPFKMSMVHDPEELFSIFWFLSGALTYLFFIIIVVVFSFFKDKKKFFIIFSLLISLSIYLFISVRPAFNENRLYLPSVFLGLLIGIILYQISTKLSLRMKMILCVAFVLYIAINSVILNSYIKRTIYKEDFFNEMLEKYPGSVILNIEKAKIDFTSGRFNIAHNNIHRFQRRWGVKKFILNDKYYRDYSEKLAVIMIALGLSLKNFNVALENLRYLEEYQPYAKNIDFYRAQYLLLTGEVEGAYKLIDYIRDKNKLTAYENMLIYVNILTEKLKFKEAIEAINRYSEDSKIIDMDNENSELIVSSQLNREALIKKLKNKYNYCRGKKDCEIICELIRKLDRVGDDVI